MSEQVSIQPEVIPEVINDVISQLSTRNKPLKDIYNQLATVESITHDVVAQTLSYLEKLGIVTEKNGKVKLRRAIPANQTPSEYLRQIEHSAHLVMTTTQSPQPTSWWPEGYQQIQQACKTKSITETIKHKNQPVSQILYLTELNLGYRWTDPTLAHQIVAYYQELPEAYRPKICVLGGLLYGEYRYQRKPLQENVIYDLNHQFAQAHDFLKTLNQLGSRLIINASDKEIGRYASIATQLATDVYYRIKKTASLNPTISTQVTTNESTFDQLYKDPLFAELRAAARHLYLPYCIAAGRTLYDSNQMVAHTKGAYNNHEGVLLLEVYRALQSHCTLPDYVLQFLQTNAIPSLDGYSPQGWHYLDDHQLQLFTKRNQMTLEIDIKKRTGNASDITLRTDTQAGLRYLQRSSQEPITTHLVVETSQHQLLISQEGFDDYVMNTPGFTDAAPLRTAQGTYANSTDLAYRMQYMRKRNGVPGTIATRKNNDGSMEFQVATRNLLEKRHGKPSVVIEWNDWQWESDTQRPDRAAQFIARTQDILLEAVKQNQEVVLIINGDIKQGVNFRGKQHAEPASRSGIDQQDTFLLELLQTSFAHFGLNQDLTQRKFTKALNQLKKVVILPGNHCWNSGFRDYGSVHMRFLKDFFEKLYLSAGIRPEDRIIAPDRVYSDKGDFYYWWMYNGQIAGYQLMAQHDILDKGGSSGSKGANNGPIMQVATQMEGLRDDMDIDFDLRGHWHRFQLATFPRSRYPHSSIPYTDGVVAIIAPSLAGGSTYEHRRGLHSFIGQIELHVGGGYLPTVRLNTNECLAHYEIKHGHFATQNLRRLGFTTDAGFDPIASGFYGSHGRQSALQKSIHHIRDNIVGPGTLSNTATRLGRH